MKKVLFLVLFSAAGLSILAQSTPNNVQISISKNGYNGSSGASGATFSINLKALSGYTAVPAAEDYQLILIAPQSALSGTETINIIERHPIFGAGTMTYQGKFDVGTNTYFTFALNGGAGLNLNLLPVNTTTYSFTIQVVPAPSVANALTFRIIDQTNNTEISAFAGSTVFSQLLMGGTNQLTASAFSTLPLTLTDFNVSRQGSNNALLNWTTELERNVSHFILEKSNNQNSGWTKIAEVPAKGNTNGPTSYSYTDMKVYNGTESSKVVFYRIRSVDLDRNEKIFPVRSLKFTATSKEISIFPNPAKDGFTISIPIVNPGNKMIRFNMVNRLGQTVHAREISAATATNYFYDIKTPGIVNGEYMLQIVYDGELLDTKKVIVQR